MIYDRFINFTRRGSFNYRLRQRRLNMFLALIGNVERPVRVLDIGGSAFYWEYLFFSMPNVRPEDYEITITNITEGELKKESGTTGKFTFSVADARAMPQFSSNEFDVVHSNSVIEHVGGLDD